MSQAANFASSSTTVGCQVQQSNPDISGVGIRISFYLQNFLLVLLVNRSWEDAPNALWTFITTSFGLTIAAIAQAVSGSSSNPKLSLYEAIQVSNLVWLANFGSYLALASYSRHKAFAFDKKRKKAKGIPRGHDNFVKFGAVVQTTFSMALTLYMWATADTFGDNPECNHDVKYVLFGANVPALGSGRILALVCTSVISTLYFVVTGLEMYSSWRSGRWRIFRKRDRMEGDKDRTSLALPPQVEVTSMDRGASVSLESRLTNKTSSRPTSQAHNPDLETQRASLPSRVPRKREMSIIIPETIGVESPPGQLRLSVARPSSSTSSSRRMSSASSMRSSNTMRSRRRNSQLRRRRWLDGLDAMLIGIIVFQIIVFAYFIVCSELYLKRNPSDNSDSVWGFGQILALIVVIPSIVSVIRAFYRHRLSRLDRRGKKARNTPLASHV
ncbi:hypothetical protein BD410DRAFT_216204 [Rickenella mellea]|uniref:Uncharacterized protein n=1 Tax=Rickenella mellea TaxID=50990 RepID=A0A4Y7QL04_9AGAM|nr:hypothetical protein BD410DRAFT_216204 [Rickenella mellea]